MRSGNQTNTREIFMEYRNLGKAGVKVSKVCLGAAFSRPRGREGFALRWCSGPWI